MALEPATYINQLNASNPLGGDARSTTDDHIRLLKNVIKATFAAITGQVTATHIELNSLSGSGMTPIKMQALAALANVSQGALTPIGGVIMWSGSVAALSTLAPYWYLCDGSNGTPNLVNSFVIGAGTDSAGISNTTVTGSNTKTGGSKDAILVAHAHDFNATTGTDTPDHTHNFPTVGGAGGGSIAFGGGSSTSTPTVTTSGASARHQHAVSGTTATQGSSATNANLPPYYALAYIMRAS